LALWVIPEIVEENEREKYCQFYKDARKVVGLFLS
jgi:hypothetical protein